MNPIKAICASLLAVVLITTFGCAGSATSESTGEYIDDTVITTRVKAALVDASDVSASDVSVETFKGVVQLSGFVDSRNTMDTAVSIASDVKGVTSVRNDMRIK